MFGRRRALQLSALPFLAHSSAARAMPMQTGGGPCVVSVSLAGQPARMVLDTGAERTVVTRAAVARLGLKLDPWVGTTMRGAAGKLDQHQNAVVPDLSLGGTRMVQRPGQPLSLPVTSFDLDGVDGLLGGDVLSHHTLVIDQPGHAFTLLPPEPAARRSGTSTLPVQLLRRFLLLTQIQIDGASLTALIDTGAGVSMLNARGMHKMGVSPQQIARDPVVSSMALGGRFNANQHRFRTLQLGVTKVDNPTLIVLATPEPAFDMVLGMDILGATRFRLSYAGAWMERG